jgi:ribosomal protein S17
MSGITQHFIGSLYRRRRYRTIICEMERKQKDKAFGKMQKNYKKGKHKDNF